MWHHRVTEDDGDWLTAVGGRSWLAKSGQPTTLIGQLRADKWLYSVAYLLTIRYSNPFSFSWLDRVWQWLMPVADIHLKFGTSLRHKFTFAAYFSSTQQSINISGNVQTGFVNKLWMVRRVIHRWDLTSLNHSAYLALYSSLSVQRHPYLNDSQSVGAI